MTTDPDKRHPKSDPHAANFRPGEPAVTRQSTVLPARAALLIIDVQYLCAVAGHGVYADAAKAESNRYFLDRVEHEVIPNIKTLQAVSRDLGSEVIFTVIESLTEDGRDRSLDHKLSGLHAAKGSREGRVLDSIKPVGDEIVIPKTSSGVFNSTSIDYLLRNLGIDYLVITGVVTSQCVDAAVRDAADRGYLVTLVEDACATYSPGEQESAIKVLAGYARIRTTREMVAEMRSKGPNTP